MAMIYDAAGKRQQVEVTLDNTVRPAKDANMSVRDFVNTAYETNAEVYGDAFSQLCESEGILLKSDRKNGIKAPSLESVLSGRPQMEAGVVVRNPSNQARVLLMPAIGALVEDKLTGDLEMDAEQYDQMIAMDTVIADEWYLWPEANFSGPEAARSQVISQLAKPATMMTLTTSEKSLRVPTYGLSIEWSDQATKYLNLDFISLSIARQIAVERNERAHENLLAMLNGDADTGQASLSSLGKSQTAVSLDGLATTGITQKAWMTWLYGTGRKCRIDTLVTDIAGAMTIQGRTGRPVIVGDNGMSVRINTNENVANPTWNAEVKLFIIDSASWPASTIMGFDSRYGIQRVTSSNATYSAIEAFAMTRSSAMRFDYGSVSRRLFNDAFAVLTYTP
jgi:hypothetical protein